MLFKFLMISILSMAFTTVLMVPFLNFMYSLGIKRAWEGKKNIKNSFFRKFHGWKVGTPTGGGALVLLSIFIFSGLYYILTSFSINWTTATLFITLLLFGLLGMYDDLIKTLLYKRTKFWGLRMKHKLILQLVIGFVISYLLYYKAGITSVYLPWYPDGIRLMLAPSVAIIIYTLTIVGSANAFNITDGLDGLMTGMFLISSLFLWIIIGTLKIPGDVELVLAVTVGALIPFLYFNIYPARVWIGDTGSMSLGSLMAVLFIMSDSLFAFPFVALVFVIIAFSSIFQMFTKKFLLKKYMKIAPIHFHFQAMGWDETKVVMRFWLFSVVTGLTGLAIALIGRAN
ncbi:MAG: phospho-N-acetylmuramoyl-pentapeptide-transferase [bacterium]|nr:phospho-N-acetylmuramoyl-pentapeptide-transferase [bacterium]